MTPDIAYTPELRAYMQRKGKPNVVVDTCSAKTCGGAMAELNLYIADDARAAELSPRAFATYTTEVGKVLVMARGLEISPRVTFGVRSFFGAKDITVEGVNIYRFG